MNRKTLSILTRIGGIATMIVGVVTTFLLPVCDKASCELEKIETEDLIDRKIDERLSEKESQ